VTVKRNEAAGFGAHALCYRCKSSQVVNPTPTEVHIGGCGAPTPSLSLNLGTTDASNSNAPWTLLTCSAKCTSTSGCTHIFFNSLNRCYNYGPGCSVGGTSNSIKMYKNSDFYGAKEFSWSVQ